MSRRRMISRALPGLVLALALCLAPPAGAEEWRWEGSRAEEVTAKGFDAVVIRPLAMARVLLGLAMMVPASLFLWPQGREGYEGAYDVLVDAPMEYAVHRDLGDL